MPHSFGAFLYSIIRTLFYPLNVSRLIIVLFPCKLEKHNSNGI